MFHFCSSCSDSRRDVSIDHAAGTVTCPACGDTRPYHSEPLLVVAGASGVGKTTLYRHLVGTVPAVVLEPDLYWLAPRDAVGEAWRTVPEEIRLGFHLLQYATVAQSGTPVVSVGAAPGDPDVVERLPEANYFQRIDYLALVCDPEEQARRIRWRPGWEEVQDEPWADVERQQAANERYRELATQRADYSAVDTTDATVTETIDAVRDWVTDRLRTP